MKKGNTANLSAYSDEFNPTLTSADEPFIKPDSTTTLAQYQGRPNNTLDTQGKLQVGGFEVKGKSYDLSSKEDLQSLKAFFHTHSTDTQEAKELFDSVLAQAEKFKIKVDFTNDLPF